MINKPVIVITVFIFILSIITAFVILRIITEPSICNDCDRKIGKSFLINLPERTEKFKRTKEKLRSIPDLYRIDGVRMKLPSANGLSKEKYGCALAHLNVLREIATLPENENSTEMWYLIFEDDVEPIGNIDLFFNNINNAIKYLPQNSHTLNMGMVNNISKVRLIVKGYLFEPNYYRGFGICAQSYAVTPEGARIIIKAIEMDNFTMPFDCVIRRKHLTSNKVWYKHLTEQYRGKGNFGSDIRKK